MPINAAGTGTVQAEIWHNDGSFAPGTIKIEPGARISAIFTPN